MKNPLMMVGLAVAVAAGVAGGVFVAHESASTAEDPANSLSAAQATTLGAQPGIEAAYAAGAEAMLRCLSDAGVKGAHVNRRPDGTASFEWDGFATREEAQKAGELYKECYFQHFDDIDRLWQTRPGAELAAVERGWTVLRCIEDASPGVHFSGDTDAVLKQANELLISGDKGANACMDAQGGAAVAFTGLPGR